jgi:hypothetical protein
MGKSKHLNTSFFVQKAMVPPKLEDLTPDVRGFRSGDSDKKIF